MLQPAGQQQININMQQNEINKLSGINFKNKSDKGLMKAAGQFEAVFINRLFQSLNATVSKDEKGMFAEGRGEKMFKSMFYDELSKNIASDPTTSFGLAKQIYEQMKDKV